MAREVCSSNAGVARYIPTVTAPQKLESPHLYERLADDVEQLISRGAFRPGDRLPSVRRYSRQLAVSVSTVLQAYLALENRGIVEARPQSGHYVRRPPQAQLPEPRVARPATSAAKVTVSDLVARLYGAARDPNVVQLGAAIPSPSLLPTEKLNRAMSVLARGAGGAGLAYDPPPGHPALRRQIARRSVEWGCPLSPDDVVTTIGTMEALHLCLRAVANAGDTVVVESPAYYGLLQLIESLEMRALEVPAHPRDGLDLSALDDALRTQRVSACLCVPNFSNPLGSAMPDAAKKELVRMLSRHGTPLIEDDIYGDLHFGDTRPRPCKAFDRDGLVMLCASFSKTVAPGYRVGWVAPGRFRERVERLKFAQTIATPTLPQMAVAEMLANGGYDHHLRRLRRSYAAQVARMTEAVTAHFPTGTRISRPTGGYVLWVELPLGTSALDLHARALAQGISVAPGPIFSARARFTNCIRLNCGYPWSDTIERAVRTLGQLARE